MISMVGAELAIGTDVTSWMLTFALAGVIATLLGSLITYTLVILRDKRRAWAESKNVLAIVYHEINDNMHSLNAGTQIGLMKVNTTGMDLLKAKNIYTQMPEDILKDLLSIYWYFDFINDIANWELSLIMVSTLTNVDANKIFEINDKQAKETHKRCVKEVQRTRILSRLEELIH